MSLLAGRLLAPWAALALLTRLVPHSPHLTSERLVAAVPWYPLAGLAVGACAALLPWLGLASSYPLVQGWIYVLVSLWATRGLHWDGLADVADAWGSGRHGAEFHAILKDSRIGAFGVIALVMGLFGQGLLAGIACGAGHWPVLLLAPVAGRAVAPVLAALCPAHPGSTLGKLTTAGSSPLLALGFVCFFVVYCSFVFDPLHTLVLTGIVAAVICSLRRLALREGGVSGDFFGTAIVLTEIAVLAASL